MIKKSDKTFNKSLLAQTISVMLGSSFLAPALAEEVVTKDDDAVEVIQVTGVRGSLSQSMNVKRQSNGVVDAISAVDMGKFPDTNLAESLQRITGVSINRVNGEGSQVTVRGFGGGFNSVTLNGRQMPAANVGTITGNPGDLNAVGTSRSFDFSNIASEGVSGIEVYKTGRAAIPSGGIGASVNIKTLKPLETEEGSASVAVRAVKDEGGSGVTPEISGVLNWVNDDNKFGISLFGSVQERNSGSRHAGVGQYQLREWTDKDLGNISADDVVAIEEPKLGQIVAIPTNVSIGINDDERTRTNAMLTMQFAPMENLTLTADATYAKNEKNTTSVTDGLWFARAFNAIEFDGNDVVSTPIRFSEDITPGSAGGKDFFFQNLALATKDELTSFGFNADLWVNDDLNLQFDIATSQAKSGGNGPGGLNTLRGNIAGATASWQSIDLTGQIPRASVVIDDSVKGNNNGIFDLPDVGSQVFQSTNSTQVTDIDQANLSGKWVVDDITVDFGLGYLSMSMEQKLLATNDDLGGWGVGVDDIPEGVLSQSCTGCAFEDLTVEGVPGAEDEARPTGSPVIPLGSVSFTADPLTLLQETEAIYGKNLSNLTPIDTADNLVEEDILSAYVQVTADFELADMPLNVVAGFRYEETDVYSLSNQLAPVAVIWVSDNDFINQLSTSPQVIESEYDYSNFLPSIDLTLDVNDEIKARASLSRTLARPAYNQLFTSTTFNALDRPTALDGTITAASGNAQLAPLESDNIDLSLEWYYSDSSMISIGYYRKDVKNFIGTAQRSEALLGLLDPSSNQPGTITAQAAAELANLGFETTDERNLFTMAAILQNPAAFPGGAADYVNTQGFADDVLANYDVVAQAGDPELVFQVTRPVNQESAVIDGLEFAWQHFFGESGFGYQFNYTMVDGDISYEVGGSISADQFALEGLSDTANLVLIYEKDGLSSRIAYNWRDEFLSKVNKGSGPRNPINVEAFKQIDVNVNYEVNEDLSVSLDIINLTEEGQRTFGRTTNNVFFTQEADRRFILSANYNF